MLEILAIIVKKYKQTHYILRCSILHVCEPIKAERNPFK